MQNKSINGVTLKESQRVRQQPLHPKHAGLVQHMYALLLQKQTTLQTEKFCYVLPSLTAQAMKQRTQLLGIRWDARNVCSV